MIQFSKHSIRYTTLSWYCSLSWGRSCQERLAKKTNKHFHSRWWVISSDQTSQQRGDATVFPDPRRRRRHRRFHRWTVSDRATERFVSYICGIRTQRKIPQTSKPQRGRKMRNQSPKINNCCFCWCWQGIAALFDNLREDLLGQAERKPDGDDSDGCDGATKQTRVCSACGSMMGLNLVRCVGKDGVFFCGEWREQFSYLDLALEMLKLGLKTPSVNSLDALS